MQLRSSNSSCVSATIVANIVLNPIIIAFDRKWKELYRAPLSQIQGMAYGVREDYENGFRGIKHNWCPSADSQKVHAWATPNLPTN